MKIFITIILLISTTKGFAKKQQRDTLFFKYDKNYILFYEDYKNLNYKEFEKKVLKNIYLSKTQGYFLLKKMDTLYNLSPKKIQSLKNYVEKRAFYFPGKYNRIINTKLLKKRVFNKHKIFIVAGKKFIEIRQHPQENFYNSYYPIKYSDKTKYPKQLRDTLFIKLDNKYLKKGYNYTKKKNILFFKDNDNKEDFTYLSIIDTLYYLKTKKIYCMKKILKQAGANYNNGKIDDSKLSNYLDKYILFVVENGVFIKTEAFYETE